MDSDAPLNDDERAELERLRAEARSRGSTGRRWRTSVAVVLIVLGCLLSPLAVIGVWANNEVSNTDRYVETVTPLASDPAIQNAVANRVTQELIARVDIEQLVGEVVQALQGVGVPPRLTTAIEGLTPSITSGVESFVREEVGAIVQSDQFERLWVQVNRRAHAAMNRILAGESQAVRIEGDTVSLDLGPVIDLAKQRLSARGLTIVQEIPEVHPTFDLFESEDLVALQSAYQWLGRLAWILPILSIGLILLGIGLLPNRRKGVIGGALGIAVGMLVLAVGVVIGRSVYLGALPSGTDATAGAAMYDIVVRFVKDGLRTILVVALIVAIAAWLTGASSTATRVREGAKRGIARLQFGSGGPVGAWVYRYRRVIRIAIVVVAVLVFVFWDRPTGKVAVLLALIVVVLLGVVELLARPPRSAPAEPEAAP